MIDLSAPAVILGLILVLLLLLGCAPRPSPTLTIQQDNRGGCQTYGVEHMGETVDIHCAPGDLFEP